MKRNISLLTGSLLVILLILGVTLVAMQSTTSPVSAQAEQEQQRTIQVTGRGQVSAQPDRAVLRLGVQTEADGAQEALDENNERMSAVISTTVDSGIDPANIQTQNFRLEPVYESQDGDTRPELVGYRASNVVQITTSDLNGLGELLDAVVAAGGNTIEGIRFEVSDQADLEAAAREAAMLDAQQKAEQLTGLAGASLGPVKTIIETGGSRPLPAVEETSLAAAVPVQAGSQTIEASVQVTWEIQ
jgi:hypothetical protein